jgi:hypothetical protein
MLEGVRRQSRQSGHKIKKRRLGGVLRWTRVNKD